MPLFTIDISKLLSSPVGTMEEFRFSQEIPADTWEDLVCHGELEMYIKLIRQSYGIECVFQAIECAVSVPSEGIEGTVIEIADVSREFHLKKNPTDTDDIEYINDHDATIDLTSVIEQELLIAGL